MGLHNKTSKMAGKHPYQRPENWLDPKWHFWEKITYTEKGKEIGRGFVKKIRQNLSKDTKSNVRTEL